MKILTMFSSLFMTTLSMGALTRQSVEMMLPWIAVMTAFVMADLAAGCRKSWKLSVRISVSTAARETLGKWVQYFALIMAVCLLSVVAFGTETLAKVVCLCVMALEGGSIMSNILRPYGIIVTPKSIFLWVLGKMPLGGEVGALLRDEEIKRAKKEEDKKWNTRKKRKEEFKNENTKKGQ